MVKIYGRRNRMRKECKKVWCNGICYRSGQIDGIAFYTCKKCSSQFRETEEKPNFVSKIWIPDKA